MGSIPKIAAVGATRGAIVSRIWQTSHYFKLTGICDLDSKLAENQALLAEKDGFPRPRIFTDLDSMLEWGDFDIVMLASPDATHYELAEKILCAGFHCYIEKPMTNSIDDAAKLVKIWKDSGKIAVIGHEWRYTKVITAAKGKIMNGDIGVPRLAITLDFCGRMGCYWRRKEWREPLRHHKNSLTLQKAIHHLDIQSYLLGTWADSVFASKDMDQFGGNKPKDLICDECNDASTCLYNSSKILVNGHPCPLLARDKLCVYSKNLNLPDNTVATIDYQTGARGNYVECFFSPEYSVEHTIIGSLGQIRIKAFLADDSTMTLEVQRLGEGQPEIFKFNGGSHGGGDEEIGRNLSHSVSSGQQIHPDPVDGYYSVATACAIDQSGICQKPVAVEELSFPKLKRREL